jgi:hypothetical protein
MNENESRGVFDFIVEKRRHIPFAAEIEKYLRAGENGDEGP